MFIFASADYSKSNAFDLKKILLRTVIVIIAIEDSIKFLTKNPGVGHNKTL